MFKYMFNHIKKNIGPAAPIQVCFVSVQFSVEVIDVVVVLVWLKNGFC